ncbi:MAG: hypothetical protein IJF03_04960 [Lachnospiraceae bacterium]|nr:hypothetical protein [Lachnospiraceae bacterium]
MKKVKILNIIVTVILLASIGANLFILAHQRSNGLSPTHFIQNMATLNINQDICEKTYKSQFS